MMHSNSKTATITGIHHITAIASSAADNLTFYEDLLGLFLVKQTVNFDDPHTYHLYYGNAEGSPGTILTFFPWEKLPRGQSGAGMVAATAFMIPHGSIDYWANRLKNRGIAVEKDIRFGDPIIRFQDLNGLPLELVGVLPASLPVPGKERPIPSDHAIFGFHSATAVLTSLKETRSLLTDVMGMKPVNRENNRYRFRMRDNGLPGYFYDLVVDSEAQPGRSGAGTVHHIAFRTKDDDAQTYWQKALKESGFSVTVVHDRKYFRSIYFHEPGGVLFEIATDPPGFAVDEASDRLGEVLQLPEQYEPMRGEIERQLPPLRPN